MPTILDGYCSTVQGLLDWFETEVGFAKLLFIQTDLCVLCVEVALRVAMRVAVCCSVLRHDVRCVLSPALGLRHVAT